MPSHDHEIFFITAKMCIKLFVVQHLSMGKERLYVLLTIMPGGQTIFAPADITPSGSQQCAVKDKRALCTLGKLQHEIYSVLRYFDPLCIQHCCA